MAEAEFEPSCARSGGGTRGLSKADAGLTVSLPGRGIRNLSPGGSSQILKAFIENGAPALLLEPSVVFISQSGEPVNIVDGTLLLRLGLDVKALNLLPDCLLMDLDPDRNELWFVEVVESDGPVHDARKDALLSWAVASGLEGAQCRFLTAFSSRTSGPAKKALPVLARGSFAWFADEPDGLLRWDDINGV
jgi:hypothetical protein